MSYISYPPKTRVIIKSTGEKGEAFESLGTLGVISVFVDGEDKCRYFKLDVVVFIKKSRTRKDHDGDGMWYREKLAR